jgi:DNA-binding NarL/FixJ family response regulator
MSEAIRIAVIDDHPMFRGGLQRAFSRVRDVKLVAEGASAADACLIAKEQQPDVMLLDVTMPGGGIEAARAIVACGSSVKTIMLTGSDDDEYVAAALAAGAQGYLLKGANRAELLEAVRTVHSGRPYVTPALSSRLLVRAARTQHLAGDAAVKSSNLNHREQQILEFAAQGLSNNDIAANLCLAVPTVKNYMSRIFQKMQVRNRVEAIAVWLRK